METYPENTLIGIEAALKCGAPYVEFDVQCTVDGVLVVFHDIELKRVTGVTGNLLEMQFDKLKSVYISEADIIIINKHKSAHTGPGKGLCSKGTHTAYTENCNFFL